MSRLANLADGIGKGVLAGLAGTTAMTVSSTIKAKLRHRAFSTAPAKAATRALGIETFDDGAAYARFSNLVDRGYGTGWGVARGVLRAIGVGPRASTPAHSRCSEARLCTRFRSTRSRRPDPVGREEIAIDVFHHLVYVSAAALAFELLDRSG